MIVTRFQSRLLPRPLTVIDYWIKSNYDLKGNWQIVPVHYSRDTDNPSHNAMLANKGHVWPIPRHRPDKFNQTSDSKVD